MAYLGVLTLWSWLDGIAGCVNPRKESLSNQAGACSGQTHNSLDVGFSGEKSCQKNSWLFITGKSGSATRISAPGSTEGIRGCRKQDTNPASAKGTLCSSLPCAAETWPCHLKTFEAVQGSD